MLEAGGGVSLEWRGSEAVGMPRGICARHFGGGEVVASVGGQHGAFVGGGAWNCSPSRFAMDCRAALGRLRAARALLLPSFRGRGIRSGSDFVRAAPKHAAHKPRV